MDIWTNYYTYWTTEGIYAILASFAIYEVFHSVFRNFDSVKGFRYLFPSVALCMISISIIRALTRPKNELVPYLAIIIALKIAVGFLQVGLFFLFILLVRLFRVQSRRYAFGIALGFGISAAGSLSFYLLRSEFGTKFSHVVMNALPMVYIIAVVVWLLTFIKAQPPHPWQDGGPALAPEELITELRQYTRVAKGVLRR
ncbi:MAG TPA: hypothetical protein VHA33_24025 [Candidatus Angelobacter sp.]|nr:hypothetical protein [Candidatus Angelobacter sp.]